MGVTTKHSNVVETSRRVSSRVVAKKNPGWRVGGCPSELLREVSKLLCRWRPERAPKASSYGVVGGPSEFLKQEVVAFVDGGRHRPHKCSVDCSSSGTEQRTSKPGKAWKSHQSEYGVVGYRHRDKREGWHQPKWPDHCPKNP